MALATETLTCRGEREKISEYSPNKSSSSSSSNSIVSDSRILPIRLRPLSMAEIYIDRQLKRKWKWKCDRKVGFCGQYLIDKVPTKILMVIAMEDVDRRLQSELISGLAIDYSILSESIRINHG